MLLKRLTLTAALVSVMAMSATVQASPSVAGSTQVISAPAGPPILTQLAAFNPAAMLAQSAAPVYADFAGSDAQPSDDIAKNSGAVDADGSAKPNSIASGFQKISDVRQALISLAMKLRDIRYVRGGRDPSTGFDCSGFVSYVFSHAIGMQLPTNSASQFLEGLKVKRADMKPGDLVFFRTHGKRNISHVGIYISNGQFIHSPTTGESVQVSSLDEAYWAKHFAGAKRPEGIAMVDHHG